MRASKQWNRQVGITEKCSSIGMRQILRVIIFRFPSPQKGNPITFTVGPSASVCHCYQRDEGLTEMCCRDGYTISTNQICQKYLKYTDLGYSLESKTKKYSKFVADKEGVLLFMHRTLGCNSSSKNMKKS